MPKSKKPSNTAEEKKAAWRTPVKLPTSTIAVEPMKSLYAPSSGLTPTESQANDILAQPDPLTSTREAAAHPANQSQEISDLLLANPTGVLEKPTPAAAKPKTSATESSSGTKVEAESKTANLSEAEFLRLLRTEKMDFYSLAEVLRGSSMALYCVLYSESLAKGENRCQMRQNELMMRVGINNPATLYKQERWLTALRLISKSVRPGNHNGASYEIRTLETLPLPNYILDQFGGYLAELVK